MSTSRLSVAYKKKPWLYVSQPTSTTDQPSQAKESEGREYVPNARNGTRLRPCRHPSI